MATRYEHTQKGYFHWLVGAIGLLQILLGFTVPGPSWVNGLVAGVGGLLVVLACSFARLTVRESGDRLEVRYGPIPIFEKAIAYGEIRSFKQARSLLIDGWGIHWIPGRGWTWNLHGRDCVELDTTRGRLRIGTDDPEGLAAHLANRLS